MMIGLNIKLVLYFSLPSVLTDDLCTVPMNFVCKDRLLFSTFHFHRKFVVTSILSQVLRMNSSARMNATQQLIFEVCFDCSNST